MSKQSPSPIWSAVCGRCPRCGVGKLFQGYLRVSDLCQGCNLDFSRHDSGDGPVVPIMLIVGTIIASLLLWLEFAIHPPIWTHMVIWPPLIVVLCLGLLRPVKAIFIGAQFKLRAVDGEFPNVDDEYQ